MIKVALLASLIIIINTQTVSAIPWNENIQARLHVYGKALVNVCMFNLRLSPMIMNYTTESK